MAIVYCHTSPSGREYVGIAARDWRARWRSHVFESRRGSPLPLHNAIRKYGPEAFAHCVLVTCNTRQEAEDAERFFIAALGTKTPYGYNATDGGEGVPGLTITRPRKPRPPATAEARARMSAAHMGQSRPQTPEHRARISAALTGKALTADTRRKLREANLGKRQSEATRAKRAASMRAAWARRRAAAQGGRP